MTRAAVSYPDAIDVIVVGTGAAGLSAALALAPKRVLLISKTDNLVSGSTPWAQGGIAAAIADHDSPKAHLQDTLYAGAGLVDALPAEILTNEGRDVLKTMITDGFPADRLDNGQISLGREGAHGENRVIHAGGDATGAKLHAWLMAAVQKAEHITCLANVMAVDILMDQRQYATGLQVMDPDGLRDLYAANIILATGGIGGCFSFSTNPAESTGDGLAIAARAGAVIRDPEFMQFHPTALAADDAPGRRGLLTEALRGAGAWLLDQAGHRFMQDVHELSELAPRDVVARAIFERLKTGERVTLDIRHVLADKGEAAFPTVIALCRQAGIDPVVEPVPVAPAAHYHMGGVETDIDGATSISGLWACGETASTGVHGANRLASNSLLEALVFGLRVARTIGKRQPTQQKECPTSAAIPGRSFSNTRAVMSAIRDVIYQSAGLTRDKAGLCHGLTRLTDIAKSQVPAMTARDYDARRRSHEIENMILVGQFVLHAALARQESRGSHTRTDYPGLIAETGNHTRLTLADIAPMGRHQVAATAAE